nr:MAG TPA: hypothetical protein [Caudoviricetes sp.]
MALKLVSTQTNAQTVHNKILPFFARSPFAALNEQDKQTLRKIEYEIGQLCKADIYNGYMARGLWYAIKSNIREVQDCFNIAYNNGGLSTAWLGNYHAALIHLGQYSQANALLNKHYRSSNAPAFMMLCAKQAILLFNMPVLHHCQEYWQKTQQDIPDTMLNKLNDRYPSDVLNILNLLALEYLYQHQANVIACRSEEEDGDLFVNYVVPKMEHDAFWDLDLGMNQHLNQIAIEQGLDNRNIVFGLEQA